MAYSAHLKPEKRKGPDLLVKWIKFSSFFVWILLFTCLLFIDQAKPRKASLLDHLFDVKVYTHWDQQLIAFGFIVAIALFIFALVSILVNVMRLKRKTDRLSISLIISIIVSSVYIMVYLSSLV
ncbi:MAG: hypothetical protein H7X94_00310 [Vallitaleaceae bacterium]|nr:hypothetical protein [Vallitaleaceae bacterium]